MSREPRIGSGSAQRARRAHRHGRDVKVAAALSGGLVAGIIAAGLLLAPVATFDDWPIAGGGSSSDAGEALVLPSPPGFGAKANDQSARDPLTGGVLAPFGHAPRGSAAAPLAAIPGTGGLATGAVGTGPGAGVTPAGRTTSGVGVTGTGGIGGNVTRLPSSYDSDGDNIPDVWWDQVELDPANKDADADGDGVSNAQEYWTDSNPTMADSNGDGRDD